MKNKKETWLLKIGFTTAVVGLGVVMLGTHFDFLVMPVDTEDRIENYIFLFVVFMGGLFAAVYEEILFRGVFTSKKNFALGAFVLSIIFILFFYQNKFAAICFFVYCISYLILFFKAKDNLLLFRIVLIFNALTFALLHSEPGDFGYISTYFFVLHGFGWTLIVLWLVINYSLIFSIAFHLLWNFIMLSSLTIYMHWPDSEISGKETEKIKLTWQSTSNFSTSVFKPVEGSRLEYEGIYLIDEVPAFLGLPEKRYISKYQQEDPYRNYNLTIVIKDSALMHNDTLLVKEIFNALEEEKLIVPRKK